MKFLIYILLLEFSVGALIPKGDLSQLSKLKVVLEHYELHQMEASIDDVSFSIVDFIYLHYISPDDHTHEEPVDHSQLIFNSFANSLLFCNSDMSIMETPRVGLTLNNIVSDYINLKEQVSDIKIFIPPCI